MKTMEELNQLLSQQAPSDPLVKLLNDTFGPLAWEFERGHLKIMARVSDDQCLTITRGDCGMLADAAKLFGLEVKDVQSNEGKRTVDNAGASVDGPRPDSTPVATQGAAVGQGGGEPQPAVPAGTPKSSRKVILDSISECSRVILAKKLRTQDQLVKMVEAFAVKRKEELNEAQAVKLLDQLTEITKESK